MNSPADAHDKLGQSDPEIFRMLEAERNRQRFGLEMIASENYTSPAILAAQGSILTNKYAEGYPGKRYYGGCEFVDEIEEAARQRARTLFGGEHVNVQPHSGSQANMGVYLAALKPGDTILGMDLAHGGHLTHGMKLNFSGKYFNVVSYKVRQQDHRLDYDEVASLAQEHKPQLIIAGASAYPRIIDFDRFAEIARENQALLLVDMAHIAGLVATGHHPNPVPVADFVTSTTHKTLRGPRSGFIICRESWGKAIDSAVFPGMQGGPLMHVIAAKALCFAEAHTEQFRAYSAQVIRNAQTLAEELARLGFPIVSGGTDNHIVLMDVFTKAGIGGKKAEQVLEAAGITVNKNMIPFDTRKPIDPSGIRLGTPALTTRGMQEPQMREIAKWMGQLLSRADDQDLIERIRGSVHELGLSFPLPGDPSPH